MQRARSNLASLYWIDRQEFRAERLFRKALAATEKLRGPMHPDVARLLMNLGALHAWLGDHLSAREALERARRIYEAPNSDARADDRLRCLEMLATEYRLSGRAKHAVELSELALSQRQKLFSANDGRTRALRRELANLYLDIGKFGQAEKVSTAELAQLRAEGESMSSSAAWMLQNLAAISAARDGIRAPNFSTALNYAQQALAIRRKLGNSNSTAQATLALAGYLFADAQSSAAQATLEQFDLEFANDSNLGRSGLLATADFLRAQLSAQQGDITTATAIAFRVEDQQRERLRQSIRGFSEGDAAALAHEAIDSLSLSISLALASQDANASAADAFTLWQRVAARRGMVFHERQRRQQSVLNNRNQRQRNAWNAWIIASRKLSAAATGNDAAAQVEAKKVVAAAERTLALSAGERGTAANKDALRAQVVGKRIVHLATHGFFLDECDAAPAQTFAPQGIQRGVGGLSAQANAPRSSRDAYQSELDEPMAGIALAGANLVDSGTQQSDGILNLAEAASLDLATADWVAVSACDSARSSARSWEGSFGLRRALAMAGARTTIMSLWAIQDSAAKEFMTALYQAHFTDQLTTAQAVRFVQRKQLAALRRQGKFADPHQWAGFVAIGDWR